MRRRSRGTWSCRTSAVGDSAGRRFGRSVIRPVGFGAGRGRPESPGRLRQIAGRPFRRRQHGTAADVPPRHGGRMTEPQRPPAFTPTMRSRLFDQRVLVLDGALDDDNGTALATGLLALAAEDAVADIALWIHSPGGSVPSMLAIRDVMRLIPNDVRTLALGLACSAGQFLLSAGTPGKRSALPHARILMHQGSAGIGGSAAEVELQADDLRHTRDTVLGLIAADTGQPVEQIFADSLHDRWYTAEQARDYGFIDRVVTDLGAVTPVRRTPMGLFATAGDGAREKTGDGTRGIDQKAEAHA